MKHGILTNLKPQKGVFQYFLIKKNQYYFAFVVILRDAIWDDSLAMCAERVLLETLQNPEVVSPVSPLKPFALPPNREHICLVFIKIPVEKSTFFKHSGLLTHIKILQVLSFVANISVDLQLQICDIVRKRTLFKFLFPHLYASYSIV